MVKCKYCKTIYDEPQRQFLILHKTYACPLCINFKFFYPFNPYWFDPEVKAIDVFNKQKEWFEKFRGSWKNVK